MSKALGIFAWIYISSLVTSVIQAEVIHKLWAWFAARDLGSGPSVGAWFGIAAIITLIVRQANAADDDKDKTLDQVIRRSVVASLGQWMGCVMLLGMAWAIGATFGWLG